MFGIYIHTRYVVNFTGDLKQMTNIANYNPPRKKRPFTTLATYLHNLDISKELLKNTRY